MSYLLTQKEREILTSVLDSKSKEENIVKKYYKILKHKGLRKKLIIKHIESNFHTRELKGNCYFDSDSIQKAVNEGLKEHGNLYPSFEKAPIRKSHCLELVKSMYKVTSKSFRLDNSKPKSKANKETRYKIEDRIYFTQNTPKITTK